MYLGRSLHKMRRVFLSENGLIGILEAAAMKLIDNVSLFIGLIFDRFFGKEDDAPTSKAFSAYFDMLLVLCNKHDVRIHSEKIRTIQNAIKIFKNATENLF